MTEHFLITGGAGFIGSHLCDHLVQQGHSVTAIDDLSTGRMENISHLAGEPTFKFVRESIHNAQVLDRLASHADTIVHLAAAVGVKLIVENPVHTIRTNIIGTESVLSAANRYQCRVVIASSSEVYGKGIKVPFSEDDDRLMGPTLRSRWSYATSKAVDEFLGLAYYKQYNLPVIILRFFNTIGPRQTGRYGMVVPRFIRQALRNAPVTVYGSGQQTRCFADVEDVTQVISRLTCHPDAAGEVFNIGSTEELSIIELAERVIRICGSSSTIEHVPYEEAYAPGFEDMQRRVPSIQKLQNLVHYKPVHSLDDTLLRVVEYERERQIY